MCSYNYISPLITPLQTDQIHIALNIFIKCSCSWRLRFLACWSWTLVSSPRQSGVATSLPGWSLPAVSAVFIWTALYLVWSRLIFALLRYWVLPAILSSATTCLLQTRFTNILPSLHPLRQPQNPHIILFCCSSYDTPPEEPLISTRVFQYVDL